MASDPIASLLAAQSEEGWWVQPGHGYGPKYSGTVWSLMFLAQMGADGSQDRIRRACEYVLAWTQSDSGAFSATGPVRGRAVPSGSIHCLNGNLLRAMLDFGYAGDPRVERSIDWQAATLTGEGVEKWYSYTVGPGGRCGANDRLPCAWGLVKALLGLAAVPPDARSGRVRAAIAQTAEFLLNVDPAIADYPRPDRSAGPSGSWFRLGFPIGYVTDVLQNMEALCDAGYAADPRLDHAFEWLLAKADPRGRWANEYAYHGKMVRDVDRQGQPSKWVTIRACRVLRARATARAAGP